MKINLVSYSKLQPEFKLISAILFLLPVCLSLSLVFGLLNSNRVIQPKAEEPKLPVGQRQEDLASKQPEFKKDSLIVKFKDPAGKQLDAKLKSKISFSSETKSLLLSPQETSDLLSLDGVQNKSLEPLFKEEKLSLLASGKSYQQLMKEAGSKYPQRTKRSPENPVFVDMSDVYIVKLAKETDGLPEIIQKLNQNEDIDYAEPNYIVKTTYTPNDQYYPLQWPLNNTGQSYPPDRSAGKGTPDADIDAPEAWDINQGEGVVVAVIDTGVDYTHRDLGGCTLSQVNSNQCSKIVPGYDYVNNDNDPLDDHGHGTHCAGIIAAIANNNYGIAGVAPKAKIMPVKFLDNEGSGRLDNGMKAISYAVAQGADVLSNSWGGRDYSQTMADAILNAYNQGVVIVASAGNGNSSSKGYPAAYNKVIAVAALDADDKKADFSSYGDWVEISAPGVDILSLRAKSTKMGMPYPDDKGKLTIASGTSMACPHVAGAIAQLFSAFPLDNNSAIYRKLMGNADWIDVKNPDYHGLLGAGRVNANAWRTSLCPPLSLIIDTNPQSIDTYCRATTGKTCVSPDFWAPSLTCFTAPGWKPFGPDCHYPYCDGCQCLKKGTPLPVRSWKLFENPNMCSRPNDIVSDNQGNVFVSTVCDGIWKYDAYGRLLTRWGEMGSGGDGELRDPLGISIDNQNQVYVTNGPFIKIFDANGRFLIEWSVNGYALDVSVDNQSNVYVIVLVGDLYNQYTLIQKYDIYGKLLTEWWHKAPDELFYGRFWDIVTDGHSNVYAYDTNNDRIKKFDANGQFITKWGENGSADGVFPYLEGIAVSNQGDIYVADVHTKSIQVFDTNGRFITKWETVGNLPDYQFGDLVGVYFEKQKNVLYVLDSHNLRVVAFQLEPSRTCSVQITNNDNQGNLTINTTGKQGDVRLWLQRKDGTPISGPSLPSPNLYAGRYSYLLKQQNSSRDQTVGFDHKMQNIPPGEYFFHCDVISGTGACSGNPICDYKGGSTNCSALDWKACSNTDFVSVSW